MFKNIIITVLVISACSGENPVPYYSMAKRTGLSLPRFQRDDTPLSAQYNTVHLQSSPSPDHDTLDHQPHHYNLNPTSFINIQYAPLVKPSSRLYTKVHSPHDVSMRNIENIEAALNSPSRITVSPTMPTTVKTNHLEPKIVATRAPDLQPQPLPHLDYIPGHNIEVLRSVNRIPGTNSVFKNRPPSAGPESINNLPQKMVNFLTPYKFNQPSNKRQPPEISTQSVYFSLGTAECKSTIKVMTTTSRPTSTTAMPLPSKYRDFSYKISRNRQQVILPKPIIYSNVDVAAVKNAPAILNANPSQQKTPYMKMHTLLLNVARAYNMALAPRRTVLHSGANPAVLGIFEPYTQTYMRAPRLPLSQHRISSNQKTILYPMEKNIRFAIHS